MRSWWRRRALAAEELPARPLIFLDANVLFAGSVGAPEEPSARLLTLALLGGVRAITVDNAVEEARRHLLAYFNAPRLKLHATETDRIIKRLHESELDVRPWVNASSSALPDNPKDAFLVEAVRLHEPLFLATWDEHVLRLRSVGATIVVTPRQFMAMLDASERFDQ